LTTRFHRSTRASSCSSMVFPSWFLASTNWRILWCPKCVSEIRKISGMKIQLLVLGSGDARVGVVNRGQFEIRHGKQKRFMVLVTMPTVTRMERRKIDDIVRNQKNLQKRIENFFDFANRATKP